MCNTMLVQQKSVGCIKPCTPSSHAFSQVLFHAPPRDHPGHLDKSTMTTPRLNSDIAESTRCTKNDILFAELLRACSKDGLHHLTRTSRQNRKKGIAQLGTGQRLKRQ